MHRASTDIYYEHFISAGKTGELIDSQTPKEFEDNKALQEALNQPTDRVPEKQKIGTQTELLPP